MLNMDIRTHVDTTVNYHAHANGDMLIQSVADVFLELTVNIRSVHMIVITFIINANALQTFVCDGTMKTNSNINEITYFGEDTIIDIVCYVLYVCNIAVS